MNHLGMTNIFQQDLQCLYDYNQNDLMSEFYKHHKAQPPDSDNSVHRSWQIHQQFKPMSNSNSYKDISQELLERINNLKIIKKLGYPSPK